jgi:RNA polymerase sigma-70 factor (ECF subfamily)
VSGCQGERSAPGGAFFGEKLSRPGEEGAYIGGLSTTAHLQSHDASALVVPFRRAVDAARTDDTWLLRALQEEDPQAAVHFFRRFSAHVERIVTRIFGADDDVSELVNETFFRAIERIQRVEDAGVLRAWLTSIAVLVARERLRHRRRRRWLSLPDHGQVPELEAPTASAEVVDAVRRVYVVLDNMPTSERIAFAFRFIEGMELAEVASACGVSLATIKRLLSRAEARFIALGRRDPVIRERLEGGGRWSDR